MNSVYSVASSFSEWISVAASLTSLLLAAIVILRGSRTLPQRTFAAGLALLAIEEIVQGVGFASITPHEVLYWHRLRIGIFSLLPGTWLLFSISFGRSEYKKTLQRWIYAIVMVYAVPFIISAFFTASIFPEAPSLYPSPSSQIPIGTGGRIFYVTLLISAVLILANLEKTIRASIGRVRWQIKFIIIGLGSICAVWIYISSQALLYSALDTSAGLVHSVALLIANCLFLWGLVRSRFLNVSIYLSHTTIQYSLTILLAGLYLVAIGVLAQLVRYLSSGRPLPLDALLILLALIGLAVLLFSDRLHERLGRLAIRHFKRPKYDYRKAWMALTENTTALLDVRRFCTEVAKIISRTLGILSVNIWLIDETETHLTLAGSTVFSDSEAAGLERAGAAVETLLQAFNGQSKYVDLHERAYEWPNEIMQSKPEYFADFKMRHILSVRIAGELVGILTLNDDRVGKAPLSIEDRDLLHAFTAHTAARVLQIRLAARLRRAKELEAFQNVSTFFVHDLKNLASRLSLTMQNLPVHFDDPDFRQDALRVIGQSVAQIEEMCGRLSVLRQKIEVHPALEDLNELVAGTLNEMGPCLGAIEQDLKSTPKALIDREQIGKVITNLLMNAQEATNGQGKIVLQTGMKGNYMFLSVKDNGCGMSREFIEHSLFQPFHTTKKQGMGIGLYQSKMIVEAHGGHIGVESREGEGSCFTVVFPAWEERRGHRRGAEIAEGIAEK